MNVLSLGLLEFAFSAWGGISFLERLRPSSTLAASFLPYTRHMLKSRSRYASNRTVSSWK